MSYVAINIPDWLPQSRNSTRSFKTALPHTNTTNTTNTTNSQSSFVTAKSYNDNNAHVVNTNDPRWLEKEGVNTSYNINVEARKRWLARQPQIRNRPSRRSRCRSRRNRRSRKSRK